MNPESWDILLLPEEMRRQPGKQPDPPQRVAHELWAPTPYLKAANGSRDLMADVTRAIAEGLFALSDRE